MKATLPARPIMRMTRKPVRLLLSGEPPVKRAVVVKGVPFTIVPPNAVVVVVGAVVRVAVVTVIFPPEVGAAVIIVPIDAGEAGAVPVEVAGVAPVEAAGDVVGAAATETDERKDAAWDRAADAAEGNVAPGAAASAIGVIVMADSPAAIAAKT